MVAVDNHETGCILPLVYIDIEADNLLPNATKVHVISCRDVAAGTIETFTDGGRYGYRPIVPDFIEYTSLVDKWCGHNIISYDIPVLQKLLGVNIPWDKVEWDTYILSKFTCFEREGGHSLKNLSLVAGDGELKGEYTGTWEDLNEEMIEYNKQDTVSGCSVLSFLLKEAKGRVPKKALKLEHEVQSICARITKNGFLLNKDKAEALLIELSTTRDSLAISLSETHPKMPKPYRKEPFIKKVCKDGSLSSTFLKPAVSRGASVEDIVGDYCIVEWIPFNPASRQQITWQLLHKGWVPTKFTDKGAPSVEEEVLEDLINTFPEAKELITYLMLEKRIAQVSKWLELMNPVTHRVHGEIQGIGTRTHRASHSNPNTGQVPGVRVGKDDKPLKGFDGTFNFECRDCWTVPEGFSLVGVDASAIQLVILAHVMNDATFTKAVETGKSSDGTDVHTLNRNILREAIRELTGKDPTYFTRSMAKTFIYAFLLGAGGAKVASICGVPPEDGNTLKKLYLNRLPKLRDYLSYLKKTCQKTGFVQNIDNRLFPNSDPHFALAFILQGYEQLIMKKALCKTQQWLDNENLPIKIVAWVHDEFQMETPHGMEEMVIKKVVAFIEEVGVELGLKCRLTGSGGYGHSWAESH